MTLYLILLAVVLIALAISLASYVSLRRTYRIEDLEPLSNGRSGK